MVKVGELAPDFTLQGYQQGGFQEYSLSKTTGEGKWVVLFFYPLDFTFVCPTEITGFNKHYESFTKAGAEVFGVSVDSIHSHKAWVEKDLGDLAFPLLSDFKKEIAEEYGILVDDEGGVALRATYIIDPEGKLRYQVVSDLNVGRSVEETVRVLKALQTGGLCPVDWQEGEDTL